MIIASRTCPCSYVGDIVAGGHKRYITRRSDECIDPLSVTLMLTDVDRADPRIEMSVDEMLEE